MKFFSTQSRLSNKLRWAVASAIILTAQLTSFAQTDLKIGSNPGSKNSSAILELESTSKGLLMPRMTTAQMNLISSPAQGLAIYNTTDNCIYQYNGTAWSNMCDPIGLGAWSVTGNNNISAATNYLGTTNGQPVIFKTNAVERGRFDATGNFGLGTASPSYRLDVDAITGASGNPMRLQGLLAGATTDSIVTSNAGVLRRMTFADLLAGGLTADNGLTFASNNVRLGGTLMQNTTIAQAGFNMAYTGNGFFGLGTASPAYKLDVDAMTGASGNPVRFQGLVAGAGTDSVLTSASGVVRRLSIAEILASGNAWLNGGNTLTSTGTFGTNSNHNFNVVTNGATRLTFENNGNITQVGTGTVTLTGPVNSTNTFTSTGATNLNTTGAAATNIGNAGSTTTVLGTTNINATGSGVTNIGSATSTTNIAGNTLNITNTPTGTVTNNVLLVDPTTGQVRNISVTDLLTNGFTASNGLTKTGVDVELGGTLERATTVAQAGFAMAYTGGNFGIGAATPNSTLQVTGSQAVSVVRTTSAVTLDATHYIVLANATTTGFTLTLPAANSCTGRTYYVGKSDESTNLVTFSPALKLTETTTIASVNYAKKFKIVSDGTDWVIYNE